MDDFFPIDGFDHFEFYVGNAKQAALFYESGFGFHRTAYKGLETGSRDAASYVIQQGGICFVLTTALHSQHPIARGVLKHGDSVAVIALAVPDAARAFKESTARGAGAAIEPTAAGDDSGVFRYSAVRIYGDTLLKFVERRDYSGAFAPGFEPRNTEKAETNGGVGLSEIDHVVGNVELGDMNKWVAFFAETMGFTQLLHFDDKQISTEYSALMSKVMQDRKGTIKFPINEPAKGRKKSQIEEFLEFHNGPGVQHIACATEDIIGTVTRMRENGIEFLPVPATYYEELGRRVREIDEPVEVLAELGILADRDVDGYLLQIFTQPVEDRPTVFFEVIERHGARGFGEGNFKSLFEAIEREQALRGNL